MTNKINKVSNETREKIRKKSVLNLPNKIIGNPELVKQAFTGLVIDSNNSALGEIDRVVEEINRVVEEIETDIATNKNDIININMDVNTHIEDLDNPHGVTAEQIDTYVKTIIDNKDANTLQEAKDYTYSQVEIDDKDAAIMNKANNLENANMFKDVNYNNVNGVLTFTKYDDTTKEIDLPLELLVESGYYDDVANELVLVLANSSEIRIPVGNLLTDLVAHNIRFNGSGTNYLVGETDVEGSIRELDTRVKTNADKLDEIDLGLEHKIDKVESRQVGETIITYQNGEIVSMLSDNVVESIEYDVNGEVEKVTSTYADGKVYEETYTKDVNGNITKIMKVEVI